MNTLCPVSGEACKRDPECEPGECAWQAERRKPGALERELAQAEAEGAEREDTKRIRTPPLRSGIPTAGPTVEDIVAMIDSLTKADRQRLLAAVRALYGSEK